jgi:hypothetical protein
MLKFREPGDNMQRLRRAANTVSCRDWRCDNLAMIIGHLQVYAGFNEDAVPCWLKRTDRSPQLPDNWRITAALFELATHQSPLNMTSFWIIRPCRVHGPISLRLVVRVSGYLLR